MKKFLLSLVTLSFLTAVFVWYVSSNWEKFQEISIVNPVLFIPIIFLVFVSVYSIGMVVELAVEPHGVKLSKNEIFGLSALTRFANQISPGYLGATVRALYLKKNYKLSYSKFSSSFILSNILQFIIAGILALIIYGVSSDTFEVGSPLFFMLIFVLMFLAILFLPILGLANSINKASKSFNSKILRRISIIIEQYNKVRSHPGLMYRTLFWVIVSLASSSLMILIFYEIIGFSVDILPAIFIAALANWTIIFSVTPAGIGVREGLMVVGAEIMNISIPATLTVAILMRLTIFLIVAILSSYYAPRLLNTTMTNIKALKHQSA